MVDYYHTQREYSLGGLERFLSHTQEYFRGGSLPVSSVKDTNQHQITFTFSDTLLQKFLNEFPSIKKPYEVAIKYGFRGYSQGGKNGIFYQGKNDLGLAATTDRLIQSHRTEVLSDLNISPEGLNALRRVKIVWHEPRGIRIVGVYAPQNKRILFLDFAHY